MATNEKGTATGRPEPRLGKDQRITDILAVEDELLRSEGIDPTWVPFTEAERAEAESLST
jgi:hypothetical protein